MEKTMQANQVRRNFGEVLDGILANNNKVVVERFGRPIAVIVPVSVYDQWKRSREEAFKRLREMAERVNMDPKEAEELVEEAIQAVRAENRLIGTNKDANE
jgi:prevent-host-death family protein